MIHGSAPNPFAGIDNPKFYGAPAPPVVTCGRTDRPGPTMRAALFAGFIAGFCAAGTAFALETFQVEDQTVRLPLPAGFCALPRTPDFNYVYEMDERPKPIDTLLTIIVPCTSLADIRVGRAPREHGQWMWDGSTRSVVRILGATGRMAFFSYFDDAYPRKTNLSELAALIEADRAGDASKPTARNLHYIDRDENAAYLASYVILPPAPSPLDLIPFAQRRRVVAWLWADTVLGQFVFRLWRFRPYEGQRTYEDLLAEAKTLMAEAAVENPPPTSGR